MLRITQLVVLQLGILYQQPFETYLHRHPASAAISKVKSEFFCRAYGVNSP